MEFLHPDGVAKLLVLYVHLLATCTAIGSLLATDLQLLARTRGMGLRLSPPNRFVMVLIGASLLVLCATGALLIASGLQQRADTLANPKLQAKLVLVALLLLNAAVLHGHTFGWLSRGKRLETWAPRVMLGVALPIAASHALWLFTAFLGIARPWNFTMPAATVLGIAAVVVAVSWIGVMAVVHVAASHQRARRVLGLPSGPGELDDSPSLRQTSALLHRLRGQRWSAPERRSALV